MKEDSEGNEEAEGVMSGTGISTKEAIFNVIALATCFGIGWANLFVQVSATPIAARQWTGTATSVVPYGIL